MKIRHRVTNNKLVDLLLGELFIFWKWLGNKLGVEISVPEPAPKFVFANADAMDALKAENAQLKRELEAIPVVLRGRGQPTGPDRPNNNKKLTDREVKNIRAMHRTGVKQSEIADIYDVNRATISRIVRGQYHKVA